MLSQMRVVFSEEDFSNFINDGFIIKDDRTIWFKKSELDILCAGDIVTQGDIEFCLSDIGFDRIYKIIGHLSHLQ